MFPLVCAWCVACLVRFCVWVGCGVGVALPCGVCLWFVLLCSVFVLACIDLYWLVVYCIVVFCVVVFAVYCLCCAVVLVVLCCVVLWLVGFG